MKLIAVLPILFESINYEPGDELPIHNIELTEIWTENGSAIWQENDTIKELAVKAKSATAPGGIPGIAYPSMGPEQDLVGKLPSRKSRGIQSEPTKGRRKSSA